MSLSWLRLKAHIEMMDEKQIQTSVTVRVVPEDEYFAVKDIDFSPADDVLDKNHPFLVMDTEGEKEEEKEDGNKHTEICCHDISYFFRDTELEIDEDGFRHIQDQICEGYIEGDLNITDPNTDETFHGFWHIERAK